MDIWSNISLFMIGKGGPAEGLGIAISPRTKHLVIVGPYRYTRNPMVFGAYLCYLSLALFFNSLLCVILLAIMLPFAIVYIKLTEEKRLVKDFGEEFTKYKNEVSMFFPLKRKH